MYSRNLPFYLQPQTCIWLKLAKGGAEARLGRLFNAEKLKCPENCNLCKLLDLTSIRSMHDNGDLEPTNEERKAVLNTLPVHDAVKSYANMKTGLILKSKKSLKRFVYHAWTINRLDAEKYIWEHHEELQFERISALGEGKDNSEGAKKNIQNKTNRGVINYVVYSFVYNGKKWIVKTEQHENGFEMFYHIRESDQ